MVVGGCLYVLGGRLVAFFSFLSFLFVLFESK